MTVRDWIKQSTDDQLLSKRAEYSEQRAISGMVGGRDVALLNSLIRDLDEEIANRGLSSVG